MSSFAIKKFVIKKLVIEKFVINDNPVCSPFQNEPLPWLSGKASTSTTKGGPE